MPGLRHPFLVAVVLCACVGDLSAGLRPITFTRQDITSQNPGQLSEGFTVGDVDGDGRPDMVEGGESSLLWYRNPDWAAQPIATGFRYSAGAAIEVADVDRDGRADVVTGRYPLDQPSARQMLWFANTAGGWVEHVLSSTAFCHDMAFGDVDGDGRVDILCADQFRDEILWLQAPTDPVMPWTSHVLEAGRRPMGAVLADIDRDGRLDAVSGRAWYRNDGSAAWPRHFFTTLTNPADPRFDDQSELDVIDLDGDGRLDIVATIFGDSLQGRLFAFFAPPDPVNDAWRAVEIDPGPLWGVHSQGVGSFDGSARPQVMVGEAGAAGFGFGVNPSPEIFVYRANGPPRNAASWERTLVDTIGTLEADVVDVDGDGRLDLAGHGGTLNGSTPGVISWWRNTTEGAAVPTTTTTTTLPAPGSCETAACVCRASAVPACTGDGVPIGVRRGLAHACRLIERAADEGRGTPRRASRLLARATRRAARAERRGRITAACTNALAALLSRVGPSGR